MKLHKTLLGLVSLASSLVFASLALAEDVPPGPPFHGPEFCKENPGKCEDARAKHEAFCQENPQKCEEMKQKRAERRAACKEDPAKCEEQREKSKQRRAEWKAKCEADPAKCEEMKQARRERYLKRHGSGTPPAGKPDESPPKEQLN